MCVCVCVCVLGHAGHEDAEDEDAEDEDACLGPEVPILLTGRLVEGRGCGGALLVPYRIWEGVGLGCWSTTATGA